MSPFSRILGISLIVLTGCNAAPDVSEPEIDAEASELSAQSSLSDPASPACDLWLLRFEADGISHDLFRDLQRTLAPKYSKNGRVIVPGSITAAGEGGDTVMLAVGSAHVYMDEDFYIWADIYDQLFAEGGPKHPGRQIYRAMTGAQQDGAWRNSKDLQFRCLDQGGDDYGCFFGPVVKRRKVQWHSQICEH
jgi:hypothetical protein